MSRAPLPSVKAGWLRRSQRAHRRSPGARASAWLALATLLLAPGSLVPAVIVVEGGCTLVEAIDAANGDVAVGGCPAGSGADEIRLTADVVLTEPDNEGNGLPQISSDITIEGNEFTVERAAQSELPFRIFDVVSSGTLTLNSMTVGGGYTVFAEDGGGIRSSGRLFLDNSTISDNFAYHGGGIEAHGYVRMDSTTVRNNFAWHEVLGYPGSGGGLELDSDAVLVNSTISGNYRGGIEASLFPDETVTIFNTTIADNASGFGENLDLLTPQRVLVVRSVVANFGRDRNCEFGSHPVDGGGNFADDTTCGLGFGELTGLDPELADNGGPTLTHRLRPRSSAVDAVDCGLRVDQRGVPRDGACDSGAFELSPELILAGSCPGQLTLTVGGLTPGGDAVIAWSPDAGRRELAQGPCAGRMIDLGAPKLLALLTADGNGELSLTRDVPAGACGVLLQVVDAATCHTSTVEQVPAPALETRE